jgi:hypothetical protein
MDIRVLLRIALLAAACLPLLPVGRDAWSASHSDAPLIKLDPQANITDVYAFVGRKVDDPGEIVLNVLVQVRPFSEPGDGVIYERFADDALYSIHITDPTTGQTVLRYDFRFSDVAPTAPPGLKNPSTILSYGRGTSVGSLTSIDGPTRNYVQAYSVERQEPKKPGGKLGKPESLATGLLTPPPNVGLRTTPLYNDGSTGFAISGATTLAELDVYTQQAIHSLPDGTTVFAGPREDAFYADTAGFFDLLDSRILGLDGFGQTGGGVDGFKGYNVLAYAIQIPLASLPAFSYSAPFSGPSTGVGVYASVSRGTRKFKKDGTPVSSPPKTQVSRMGNPLFNEVLVALQDKDRYNRTSPVDDAQFDTYARNPELATLLNFVFGSAFVSSGRTDLAAIFIPDVLRVNTNTGPVRLPGQTGFSRLGFIAGDTTAGVSGGWPNGRRPGDDVVDIALTAIASGPSYSPITLIGDNVAANDQVYHQVFPYLATPHSGTKNRKDP